MDNLCHGDWPGMLRITDCQDMTLAAFSECK